MIVPTMNVHLRVLRLRVPDGDMGTGFALDRADGKRFLVTAAHVLPRNDPEPTIFIRSNVSEVEAQICPLRCAVEGVDVAVAPLSGLDHLDALPLEAGDAGFALGQDVWFVGFPMDLAGIGGVNDQQLPLVKKACLSGSLKQDGHEVHLLDGHNNRGMSGAPVVGFPFSDQPSLGSTPRVIGVVSANLEEDGANSGIIAAYNIRHAIETIEEYPA